MSLVVAAVVAVATVALAGDIAVQDGFESRFRPNLDLPGNISCEADMTVPCRHRPSVAAAKKTAAMRLLQRLQSGGHGIVRLMSSSRPTKLYGKNM